MILLTSTSDKVQLVTTPAADIEVGAFAIDRDATPAFTAYRKLTEITTATTTDIVAAPGSNVTRNVKEIFVKNNDTTDTCTCTLQVLDGTATLVIEKVDLAAGERLQYIENDGITVFDSVGRPKGPPLAVGSYITNRLASTVSSSSTTAAKVTGLDTALSTGTYIFEYFLRFQSATGTVGWKLSCAYSGTSTTFDYTLAFPTGTTTDSTGVADQVVTAPGVMAVQANRAEDTTAAMIMTAGVDTTASDILVQITGLLVATTTGNLELYHASETATSTSIMLDSLVRVTKFA